MNALPTERHVQQQQYFARFIFVAAVDGAVVELVCAAIRRGNDVQLQKLTLYIMVVRRRSRSYVERRWNKPPPATAQSCSKRLDRHCRRPARLIKKDRIGTTSHSLYSSDCFVHRLPYSQEVRKSQGYRWTKIYTLNWCRGSSNLSTSWSVCQCVADEMRLESVCVMCVLTYIVAMTTAFHVASALLQVSSLLAEHFCLISRHSSYLGIHYVQLLYILGRHTSRKKMLGGPIVLEIHSVLNLRLKCYNILLIFLDVYRS